MDNLIEQYRKNYMPKSKIKVLFVGESAPAGGTFFYCANSNLFRYTKEAFSKAFKIDFLDGQEFLKFFQSEGYYLDDLCLKPVNNLTKDARKSARNEAVYSLAKRIKVYRPDVIICVMKGIQRHVREAISVAEVELKKFYSLPFPALGNQSRYVIELTEALLELKEKQIL